MPVPRRRPEGPNPSWGRSYSGLRPTVVFHFIGLLVALIGALMLLPLLVSIIYREHDQLPLLASSVVSMLVGGSLWLTTRNHLEAMERKESFVVVALSWALVSVFGAMPYLLAGTFTSPIDAYFETISGFTTTGASVLSDIEGQPHGILFWRDMTQWIGGMGIIALFIALVPLTRVGAAGTSALFEDEAPAPQVERITPRIRDMAKALWLVYLGLTAAEVILLVLVGMPLYDAVTNSFGTMATGGFSPKNASIAYYDSAAVDWIIIVFMALAGINFGLYYLVLNGKVRRAVGDTELRVYLGMLVGASLLVGANLLANATYDSPLQAIRFAAFQMVSLQTTTGFATADYDSWAWFPKLLMLFVMVVGGSSGSTGSGMKVVRFIIVAKYAHRQLYSVFKPRVISPLKLGGRVISENLVRESMGFFIVFQSIIILSSLAITAMGVDFITALSSSVATAANVGPGLGAVGPVLNFSTMPDLAKVIYTFNMWVGRLELWTVLILFRPGFWRDA